MTFIDPNEPARVPSDYSAAPPQDHPDRDGISVWGFPLILIVALVILGFVFFGTHERSTTAANNASPPPAQSTPAPAAQPAPAPGAAKAPAK
jgi:zona occludens toxin (predicted ATPase)